MIRSIPVDSDRAALVATGHVEPLMIWREVDGRRQLTDDQERDEATGHLLWTVHLLAMGADRPETIGVRVPSPTRPEVAPLQPVGLERLEVAVRVGRDGRVAGYWSAAGVAQAHRGGKQHQDAA